jgi:hypothetical protein
MAGHLPAGGLELQPVDDRADDLAEPDLAGGRRVFVELDARQRQQIGHQARHALPLLVHDGKEALTRGDVLARGPAQGLDESHQRTQGRAQLMACIGHEINAHAVGAFGLGDVVECEEGDRAVGDRTRQSFHAGQESLFDGDRQRKLDDAPIAALEGRRYRINHLGAAQHRDEVAAGQRRAERGLGGLVGAHDPARAIQHDQRVGQAGDHGLVGGDHGLQLAPARRPVAAGLRCRAMEIGGGAAGPAARRRHRDRALGGARQAAEIVADGRHPPQMRYDHEGDERDRRRARREGR